MLGKDPQRLQAVLPFLLIMVVTFSRISPFEEPGSKAPLVNQPLGINPQMCASTAVCTVTGRKTAKVQGQTDSPILEGPPHKQASDAFEVQYYDNLKAYFEYESGITPINVKGRLKNSIEFWRNINTSEFILDVIQYGYKIPLLNEPESVFLRNTKSALDNKEFVENAIMDLVNANSVLQVSNRPHVVNPLTVSFNSSGKGRLILDLRHVNKQVIVHKVKFEDWKVASQFLTSHCYGFIFDLKSGYHHVDIFSNHQKYLGFSWVFNNEVKYFVFTVLPFGLSSAGYIFTNVVRPLVSHWQNIISFV